LAFVALLLPNTEGLFKRWRTTLTSLLLMYPIVSIIFGGSQIAGFAILSTAAHTTDPLTTWIAIITGQFVVVAPFFFLPTILIKFSGGNLDKLAATIQNRGQKRLGGLAGSAQKAGMQRLGRGMETLKYRPQSDRPYPSLRGRMRGLLRSTGRELDQVDDRNKLTDTVMQKERQKASNTRLGTDSAYATRAGGGSYALGQQVANRAQAAAEAEALKEALTPLLRNIAGMDAATREKYLNDEARRPDARGAAALHYSASIGDANFMRKQLSYVDSNPEVQAIVRRQAREAVNANAGALVGKAPSIVKGAGAAFGTVKAEDMATWDETTAQEFADHVATLTGGDLTKATDAFNVAINNLADNPALKGKFSTETAKRLQSAIVAKPTLSSTLVTSRIGSDGSLS